MATARQLPADVYRETLSRLPPLKRETLNKAQQKAYDAVTAPRSGRLNLAGIKGPGGVILRMPKLAKPLGDVNRVLDGDIDSFITTFLMKRSSGTLGEPAADDDGE